MRIRNAVLSIIGAICLVLGSTAMADAVVLVNYEMNEPTGATVLDDTGPNNLDGRIGTLVQKHVSVPTNDFGLTFQGPRFIANDERLATVPDNVNLDPGTLPYRVTVRFRTSNGADPNIIQKGQSGQTGGFWKLVLHQGWPRCHFRDSNGATKAIGFVKGFPSSIKAGDGLWHTLICERLSNGVRITIDPGEPAGVGATNFLGGSIGNINNSRPLSIGGKVDCDIQTVGCDYFDGTIAWARIERP